MLKKIIKKAAGIRPVHMLAVLFLVFIFYVGLAAIPQFLVNTGKTFLGQNIDSNYIKTIDKQYAKLLGTEAYHPPLQNAGTYINFNGFMAKTLYQTEMNDRIVLKNGHLFNVESQHPDPETIQNAAKNIINFHNAHTSSGGNFLFVMVPSQISKYEDLLPAGYTDTTNATADTFLSLLEQAGVPYLDLREEMQKNGMSITDAYFVTDHHWKPQTGFWAFGKMMEKLDQMGAISPVDPFYTDPNNYTFDVYDNSFLGSAGKRTGIYFAGVDESVILRPNFETDISIQIPYRNLDLQGRYEDVAYNTDMVHNFDKPDFYQENFYGLYGWGDMPITYWRNAQAPDQSKFLLIGESFGNIPFSLMSLCFASCDEIDLRYFDQDFREYYYSYAPDTVIVELNILETLNTITRYTYLE